MTFGQGADSGNGELDRLKRQYPRWRIWRGHTTGHYWALPPRDHPTQRDLIGAGDLDELAQRLSQAEQRYDLLPPVPLPVIRYQHQTRRARDRARPSWPLGLLAEPKAASRSARPGHERNGLCTATATTRQLASNQSWAPGTHGPRLSSHCVGVQRRRFAHRRRYGWPRRTC
jgi:hypothetical protein